LFLHGILNKQFKVLGTVQIAANVGGLASGVELEIRQPGTKA